MFLRGFFWSGKVRRVVEKMDIFKGGSVVVSEKRENEGCKIAVSDKNAT